MTLHGSTTAGGIVPGIFGRRRWSTSRTILLLGTVALARSSFAFAFGVEGPRVRAGVRPVPPPRLSSYRVTPLVQRVSVQRDGVPVDGVGLDGGGEMTRGELEKLTVKRLKEIVKDMDLPIKTSHIRLKADIVQFILQQTQTQTQTDNEDKVKDDRLESTSKSSSQTTNTPLPSTTNSDATQTLTALAPTIQNNKPTTTTTTSPKRTLRRMPRIEPTQPSPTNPPPTDPSPTDHIDAKPTLSPKDKLFEEVMLRYPPLRILQESIDAGVTPVERLLQQQRHRRQTNNSTTPTQQTTTPISKEDAQLDDLSHHVHPSAQRALSGLGELDVRQRYHPMLADATSSDLDIVFVGTASCIPGLTRGVSCTAVRVQGSSRKANAKKKGKGRRDDTSDATVEGEEGGRGVWIFDAGECSQVRIYIFY